MGRPYSIPDPNDRSKNDPSTIVSSDAVLSIYNRYNDEADEMQRVTDKVRDWFLEKSKGEGWDDVKFASNQCILTNEFK